MTQSPDSLDSYDQPARPGVQMYRLKFWARRYWWIVALAIMIGLGVADFFIYRDKPRYVSQARMIVSGRLAIPQGEIYNGGVDIANFYGTQVTLMKSPQMTSQAIERVTTLHPEVAVDDKAEADAGVELRTSIFDLRVTSTNPDYAKLLLDAIMDTYLSSKREWKNQTTDEAVSAITEELSHLDAQIRDDGQQMLDFQKTNNVVFIEEQSSSAAAYLVSLNSELAQMTKQRDFLALVEKDPLTRTPVETPAPANATGSMLDSAPGEVAATGKAGDVATAGKLPQNGVDQNTEIILTEQDKIEKLKILRDQYGQYLKDAHPKMKDLAEQIDQEEKFLEMLKARNSTDRSQRLEEMNLSIQNLGQQIKTWSDRSLELSQRLATYQDLKSKITREQNLYNQLSPTIQNVDLNKSMDQADVVILEAASPALPIKHNYFIWLLGAAGGGTALGLLIVFVAIRLDDKINSAIDLEENVGYPLVGEIPLVSIDKKSKRVPLVSEDDMRHEFLEHHRDIRSNILFGRSEATRNRSLMITSAAPGEGKSTLAANLAATFAFPGFRVLLIDGDLRRGILHTIFDLPVGPGLSDYLQSEVHWRDLVQTTNILNLDVITRGKVPSGAGDLLLSAATDSLILDTALEYDIVLWDTAPLFAAHDAANLCSRVDGVIFLARVQHSSVNLVRSALNDLAQRNAKIFGVVLNAVQSSKPSYYHKYRYKEYGAVTAEV